MRGWKIIVVIASVCACLTGCDSAMTYASNPSINNLPNEQRMRLARVEASGIQIIKEGARFTFEIPTDCFFVKSTRELKDHRDVDIDTLAYFVRDYLQVFSDATVSITGYTDTSWISPTRDRLSLQYAKTIATLFLEDGVDGRKIVARGKGAGHPIASNHYPMGTSFNRRVEIIIQ
ncbi:MAG: OmpA/MotB protein [uncultured bacterium]|nr:MAG: OmpA/MotB protein [uncultured bacterium]OGT25626.1 MAG: hypothetical protein A3B71_06245 [Gammaproteobacteria bacterium RIFCSPHIGHO2_02_FULL_42_43]OGT28688.1 MAG: hypothetical protein A2624_01025 [Gammaproteobacteria bacterium RIFCSPHIGHO2_01_FULL_42_8]OGT51581.1 MAG: hypothetical protein A3E54_06010 [Gammaproteobacteria bacterium RIFCSPHIGHO2_12_FULL_41_25]OGT62280.1 MAG: hypothetical protein A3I77_04945 [Gammaproteobacteria bacterium RIFCSPLOWO2_02_FULL_42_14]OGT85954.1 MAG: hypothet